MQTPHSSTVPSRLQLWWRSLAALALMAAIAACGGGGGGGGGSTVSGVNTGSTGSFTSGSISGFGSIIVNGVRFDDSAAAVKEEDGDDARELKLGMMVAINSSVISAGSTATASTITFEIGRAHV